jgi:hypothetical protein
MGLDWYHDATLEAKSVPIEAELARRGIALKRVGRELVGPCPVCGGRDRFAVSIAKQVFNCRGCGARGDIIDFVRHLDGIGFAAAVTTLTGETPRRAPTVKTMPKISDDTDHERRQHAKAAWLWRYSQPIVGSIAERYLRKVRGITCALPPTLGFLPPRSDEQHPALIAVFALPDEPEPGVLGEPRNVDAVHLTLLKPDGSGKAEVETPKLFIGRPLGRPIVLAPISDSLALAVTEGIEDGLSLRAAFERLGVWVAGSASHLPALAATIPDYVETVTIWAHPDDDAGRNGVRKLAELLHQRGIEVRIEGDQCETTP